MDREHIFSLISVERNYQDQKWGSDFDAQNTPNDWVAYIASYLGKAVEPTLNQQAFRKNMLKVAALAVAALEREKYAPRHYDKAGD